MASRDEMIALIREAARAAGLPEEVALATAEVESGFNPSARGDLHWHERQGGDLYRRLVRDNPRLAKNPARMEPTRWFSYGLFQLLSPHWVKPEEPPEVLFDPHTNTQRGVAYLARLYKLYEGDTDKVRVHYGAGSLKVGDAARAQLLSRFRPALARWRRNGSPPPSSGVGGLLLAVGAGLMFYFLRR